VSQSPDTGLLGCGRSSVCVVGDNHLEIFICPQGRELMSVKGNNCSATEAALLKLAGGKARL